jgi:hypothetical protein
MAGAAQVRPFARRAMQYLSLVLARLGLDDLQDIESAPNERLARGGADRSRAAALKPNLP